MPGNTTNCILKVLVSQKGLERLGLEVRLWQSMRQRLGTCSSPLEITLAVYSSESTGSAGGRGAQQGEWV